MRYSFANFFIVFLINITKKALFKADSILSEMRFKNVIISNSILKRDFRKQFENYFDIIIVFNSRLF